MNRPIYLDYSATTPVDPRVVEKMIPYLYETFGNPASSSHAFGWEAKQAVEQARRHVAELIGAEPTEIVWTSGATEGNNLAIIGAARANRRQGGGHLITVATEHKAVLDAVAALESEGFRSTVLRPGPDGLVDPAAFAAAIQPDTILASVMLVNNEIGVIQPVEAIAAICRSRGVLFHCDAVQAGGKIALDVNRIGADLLTITAHKMYGPKGIGALYVRRAPRPLLQPLIHGGGHEGGMRSGTLPVHQIVGFGEAARLAREEFQAEAQRIRVLRDELLEGLRGIPGMTVNGTLHDRVPHNLNISFELPLEASLMMELQEIAVSAGSACNSASPEPSHVLRAIGRSTELAQHSIRITLGRYTTPEEIRTAVEVIRKAVASFRAEISGSAAG